MFEHGDATTGIHILLAELGVTMTSGARDSGWFEDVDPADLDGAREAIEAGSAASPADWPALAVDAGFADDEADYYDRLHEATVAATRALVRKRERADDQQLIHAVRAMDDCERTANELAERVTEWAGSRDAGVSPGIAGAREIAADPTDEGNESGGAAAVDAEPDQRVLALAERVRDLDDEATALRDYLERTVPTVAPNLAALAGPVLAARLIALAGGLEGLAKSPSGTVQVLGAEDALFAHLQGGAPSPKHGVIYTHEAVRHTRPDDRGSAARALAGKLSIAARVDHYSGDRRPGIEDQLAERIERIRAREGES